MKKLQESFLVLEELLRQANALISPISFHDDLKLLSPEKMAKDAEKNKSCYLTIRRRSGSVLFPICSRNGAKCPQMIQFSLKMANKLAGKPETPPDQIQVIIKKLERLQSKYSKPIPKPPGQAYLKGLSTKKLRKQMGK